MATDGTRRRRVPPAVERALDAALDKALAVQRPVVLNHLDRMRRRRPELTPAQLVRMLERRYVAAVVSLGGASGAAAAVPGAGTAASLATGAAEVAGFVSASAMYVLALAELHGIPVSDPDVRRALVVAVLLGKSGRAAVEVAASGTTTHWAELLSRPTARDKLGGLNTRLGRMLLTRFGARQGALTVGRALPLGIGAGIGVAGNAALARNAISSARTAFGPPPARFPARVIDLPTSRD
jgi:hypothetical protein